MTESTAESVPLPLQGSTPSVQPEAGSSLEALRDCYRQNGYCNQKGVLDALIARIEGYEPDALSILAPGTVRAANLWLTEIQKALFSHPGGSQFFIGYGPTAPHLVWISERGEVVLEWSVPNRRLSIFLHLNHKSAVCAHRVGVVIETDHHDNLTPSQAADLLMAFWDDA